MRSNADKRKICPIHWAQVGEYFPSSFVTGVSVGKLKQFPNVKEIKCSSAAVRTQEREGQSNLQWQELLK